MKVRSDVMPFLIHEFLCVLCGLVVNQGSLPVFDFKKEDNQNKGKRYAVCGNEQQVMY